MDEPSMDEKIEAQGCMAAVMHLEASEKYGRLSLVIIVVAVIASIIEESYWPAVVGTAISFAASYFIRNSCIRYLEQTTGMPMGVQLYFWRQYKSDKEFASKVDAQHKAATSTAGNLK